MASLAGVVTGAVFDLDLGGLVPRTRRLNGVGDAFPLSEYDQSKPVHWKKLNTDLYSSSEDSSMIGSSLMLGFVAGSFTGALPRRI